MMNGHTPHECRMNRELLLTALCSGHAKVETPSPKGGLVGIGVGGKRYAIDLDSKGEPLVPGWMAKDLRALMGLDEPPLEG